jgi:hypothetical protein
MLRSTDRRPIRLGVAPSWWDFNFLCLTFTFLLLGVGRPYPYPPWTGEGCVGSMQCNVEFGYQLSICSETKENHGKRWSSWPVAGPSGSKLTSSQQSYIKSASHNISPYLCRYFIFPFFFIHKLFFTIILWSYNLDNTLTVYKTCGRNAHTYEQICIQIYIYICLWFFDYR